MHPRVCTCCIQCGPQRYKAYLTSYCGNFTFFLQHYGSLVPSDELFLCYCISMIMQSSGARLYSFIILRPKGLSCPNTQIFYLQASRTEAFPFFIFYNTPQNAISGRGELEVNFSSMDNLWHEHLNIKTEQKQTVGCCKRGTNSPANISEAAASLELE